MVGNASEQCQIGQKFRKDPKAFLFGLCFVTRRVCFIYNVRDRQYTTTISVLPIYRFRVLMMTGDENGARKVEFICPVLFENMIVVRGRRIDRLHF